MSPTHRRLPSDSAPPAFALPRRFPSPVWWPVRRELHRPKPACGAHAIEIALDGDMVSGDLLARGIEKYDVGLTYRGADDIGALRGADDGVGNFGIRDQHILDVARQVDHEGFADAQRKKARIHRAIGGQRRRDPVVTR